MKNINIKSKKGFTLIELLVVIGILAVLAAIAIPSVAGLIDRANISSDTTNADEMTNAMERFASEYELYYQDLSSVTLNIDDLDSAQSRVYNVLGATNRSMIEFVEVDKNDEVKDDQIAIYRDTKYPANAKTAQLVIKNYTKTSSSTFEPKQSDMHYWYSPSYGIIVFAEPEASTEKLNELAVTDSMKLDDAIWVDLTICDFLTTEHNNRLPLGASYFDVSEGITLGYNDEFPETVSKGDIYKYGSFEYHYDQSYIDNTGAGIWIDEDGNGGWGVAVINKTLKYYSTLLTEVNNYPIVDMHNTFAGCTNMIQSPAIPDTVKYLIDTYSECYSLKEIPKLPSNAISIYAVFHNCTSLGDIGTFEIPATATDVRSMFSGCTNITGKIVFNTAPIGTKNMSNFFYDVSKTIIVTGNYGEEFKNYCQTKYGDNIIFE